LNYARALPKSYSSFGKLATKHGIAIGRP
jgi:hypothetical protein